MNNLSLIIALVSLALSIYSLFLILRFNKLKALFLSGKNGRDLESAIETLVQNQSMLHGQQGLAKEHLQALDRQLALATQKVGLIRFNPFDDGGGNFSFCLALLDAEQNGVVITSMHGRQQNRIYSKKIKGGRSETDLTDEELQAINQANTINH